MTLKNTNAELTIHSVQMVRGEEQSSIMHEDAQLDVKNGKTYVRYNEHDETGVSENKICFVLSDEGVVVTRTGVINARLVYRENEKTETNYRVPYGILNVEVFTRKITASEKENGLLIEMDYDISIGGEKLQTMLTLDIKKKEKK